MKKPRARKSCKLQQLYRESVEEAFSLERRSDTCMVGKRHVVGRGALQKEQVSLQKNKCRFCQASEKKKRQERKRENFVLFWFRPPRVGRPSWPLRWLRGSMASWEGKAQHLIKVMPSLYLVWLKVSLLSRSGLLARGWTWPIWNARSLRRPGILFSYWKFFFFSSGALLLHINNKDITYLYCHNNDSLGCHSLV